MLPAMRKPKPVKPPEIADEKLPKPTGHLVGYARVSMDDQDNRRQRDALMAAGVEPSDIWEDHASGRSMSRRGWQGCYRDLQPGDTLVIASIDRLSRDLVDLVLTCEDLKKRGVGIKCLNFDIDTTTAAGEFMFHMLCAVAQWERRMIVERTKSGLAAAKARGALSGRKPIATEKQLRDAHRRIEQGAQAAQVATDLGFKSRGGLYRAIDRLRKDGKL